MPDDLRRGKSYFYPRPPRGGRRFSCQPKGAKPDISIHALREEGDKKAINKRSNVKISIHALREEGDAQGHQASGSQIIFLSTPSARRATVRQAVRRSGGSDFYPRPPRGGRRQSSKQICRQTDYFYPRPPRGGRRLPPLLNSLDAGFLSTPSARRATRRACNHHGRNKNFYPRPPRGGRPSAILRRTDRESISIHALREEGDLVYGRQRRGKLISIHALREEGDAAGREERRLRADFYPRPP